MTTNRLNGAADPEFDEYANDYNAGMDQRVKRMLGDSAAAFIDVKVRWLKRTLSDPARSRTQANELKLLDYGVGDGLFLERVQQLGIQCRAYGCDISQGMLLQAQKRLAANAEDLALVRSGRLDFDDNTFDVAVLSSVLHHVAPPDRMLIYQELNRVIAPGGLCVIFEHNPYHPVVRYVVAKTPIDHNAELLGPRVVCQAMQGAGFETLRTRWLMFFPPRWNWLHAIEPWLEALPIGGQYVVAGAKPEVSEGQTYTPVS